MSDIRSNSGCLEHGTQLVHVPLKRGFCESPPSSISKTVAIKRCSSKIDTSHQRLSQSTLGGSQFLFGVARLRVCSWNHFRFAPNKSSSISDTNLLYVSANASKHLRLARRLPAVVFSCRCRRIKHRRWRRKAAWRANPSRKVFGCFCKRKHRRNDLPFPRRPACPRKR